MADTLDHRDVQAAETGRRVGRIAGRIGVLALLPFIVLAAWLASIALDHPWRAGTISLLTTWSALYLTFLGGIRWGVAIGDSRSAAARDLALSALSLVLGWAAFAAPIPYTFAALAVVYAAVGAWDSLASHAQAAPAWYGRLRVWQTIIIVVTLIVAFVATS
ncbi:MAG: DUF3429 domain-containing protein [Rhizobiaceae bacterium]